MDTARQLRRTRFYAGCVTAGAAVGAAVVVAGTFAAPSGAGAASDAAAGTVTKLDQVEVKKLSVIDDDGTRRLVLANDRLSPAPEMDGTRFGPEGGRPGLIFFNGEGDESGGLLADNVPGKGAQLSFDQHEQDQTVTLRYREQDGENVGGLFVQDRPDAGLSVMVKEVQRIRAMPGGPARDRAMAAFEKTYPAPQRVFVGKDADQASEVKLADGAGRPRITLTVARDGAASLDFLDATGKVTRTIRGDR